MDPAYLRLFEHILALADIPDSPLIDKTTGFQMDLDELMTEMPVEMDISVNSSGLVFLGSSPPMYYADTSIQPVYHLMKIVVVAEKNDSYGNAK